MSTPKNVAPPASHKQIHPAHEEHVLFTKDNYKWMLIGAVVLTLGFFLMAGGKSSDPNVFSDAEVYSFRRITLAPILIVAGFIIEIYAIIKKHK